MSLAQPSRLHLAHLLRIYIHLVAQDEYRDLLIRIQLYLPHP
jgi:hypothetical protein